ncbi:putative acyl-CoA ligase [Actinomadura sp. NBRC 104425]|uniref:AMP-binding protein n=1 Tax=Actinomadura sp. NBRC 104425 TaxID=3032204 RepID=UPI0024A1AF74|nr:AMP-binding protein [Actinomadura sp. NBRC 104425]GLZ15943.1 putative acyl-CoA ligase [Actinomadura sp. NBRC 104425]
MYPGQYAISKPDHPAMIMAGGGERITYAELDRRSIRLARVLDHHGLAPDATVAVVCENRLEWAEMIWAVARSGRCCAPVNRHLGPAEMVQLLRAADADALLISGVGRQTLREVVGHVPGLRLTLLIEDGADPGGDLPDGCHDYHASLAAMPDDPLPRERLGGRMMFSSGTTGTPKGIRHPGSDIHPADAPPHLGGYTELFGFDGDTVYLSPAPTYHTAPFRFVFAITQLGGTVVSMGRFDPVRTLEAIERYRVTHAQFVPTMLQRMLRLPEEVRRRFDLSSLKVAITGAAPCPPELKLRIMDWWGPVLHELYGASESYGNCHIGPQEMLRRPASVGRALRGTIHITDEDGRELPPGRPGTVWFEGTAPFEYQGDPAKTRDSGNPRGWRTVGDVGYLDEEGYLYLTGRRDHLIISGGVNIHPQEAEDVLAVHPKVEDVAVIGVPDEEYGQSVKAVVVAARDAAAGPELAAELIAYCRDRLAHYKCPRSVDFTDALPRGDNGKLYKNRLKERYAAPPAGGGTAAG